jgi:hypothetical protein
MLQYHVRLPKISLAKSPSWLKDKLRAKKFDDMSPCFVTRVPECGLLSLVGVCAPVVGDHAFGVNSATDESCQGIADLQSGNTAH